MTTISVLVGIASFAAAASWWFTGYFKDLEDFLCLCGLRQKDSEFWKGVRVLEPPTRAVARLIYSVVIPALLIGLAGSMLALNLLNALA